ncbi:MAG TPA: 4Fe-4S binding protein [Candidatus Limnocylindrales bacterium]|nr:4Fe-4S binding protein [Candidatus Limnocylindrales bacterium]
MGGRPRWYLRALAKAWKLSYVKPSMPIIGKVLVKVRAKSFTPENFNISHLPVNVQIESTNTALPVFILEDIIRHSTHRTIIHRCTCREARQCIRYSVSLGCLHIGEATEEEDTTVARHISVEEAIEHLHKAVGAGLIPFMGHAAGDNVIWNVSRDRPFLTVCFCCPCCCTIFYGYKHLSPEAQATFHRLEGISILINHDKCIGCSCCAGVCFTGAISIRDNKADRDDTLCKMCGICADFCPQFAVSIHVDDLDLTVGELFKRINEEVGGLPKK